MITTKMQVTIPKTVAKSLRVKIGDIVRWEVAEMGSNTAILTVAARETPMP